MNFNLRHIIILTALLFSGLLYATEELPPPRETVLNSAQCCLDSNFTVILNYPFGKRTSGLRPDGKFSKQHTVDGKVEYRADLKTDADMDLVILVNDDGIFQLIEGRPVKNEIEDWRSNIGRMIPKLLDGTFQNVLSYDKVLKCDYEYAATPVVNHDGIDCYEIIQNIPLDDESLAVMFNTTIEEAAAKRQEYAKQLVAKQLFRIGIKDNFMYLIQNFSQDGALLGERRYTKFTPDTEDVEFSLKNPDAVPVINNPDDFPAAAYAEESRLPDLKVIMIALLVVLGALLAALLVVKGVKKSGIKH